MEVVLFHQEYSVPFNRQLIEDNDSSGGFIYDHTPGAGLMMIAAMRQHTFYAAGCKSHEHKEYLLDKARTEVRDNLSKCYVSSSLMDRLLQLGVSVSDIYKQPPEAKSRQ